MLWYSMLMNARNIVQSIIGITITIILGILDYLTGPNISFTIFYLGPIIAAAWFVGLWAGIAASLAAGVTWLIAETIATRSAIHPLVHYWNAVAETSVFVMISVLVYALKGRMELEKRLARTDYLTGIANGRSFSERTQLELHRARRDGTPMTVVMMDLDDFKHVNDRFGHNVGDKLLRLVAKNISERIRSTDLAARLGGDEFAVLLPETDQDNARTVVEKVLKGLKAMAVSGGWPVSFSIGVVTYADPKGTPDTLLSGADILMYEVKKAGKDNVMYRVENGREADDERDH